MNHKFWNLTAVAALATFSLFGFYPRTKLELGTRAQAITWNSNSEFFKERAYCELFGGKSLTSPADEVKISMLKIEQGHDGRQGTVVYLHSQTCPDHSFSKVVFDTDSGQVKSVLDCHQNRLEEILMTSGMQGRIHELQPGAGRLSLALLGPGFFALKCGPDLILDRAGNFTLSGNEVRSGPCLLLNQAGTPFLWEEGDLDEKGCSPTGECVAVVEALPEHAKLIQNQRFLVETGSSLASALEARVFQNWTEEFSADRPVGPTWTDAEIFYPNMDCESH